jgi:hypothetical protein
MSETRKTLTFGGIALLLLVLVLLTAPKRVTPDALGDLGETFFPEFTDPNVATTLEVIEFNEETATAVPFKVTFKEGKWTIPSHHDHPADGKDRLAKTAAGVIGITKDDYRSNSASDQELCGVVDPLDDTVSTLTGRGKRVTIRGEGDQVLADLIIGKKLEDRQNLYFIRVPGQKRIYASALDLDISTKFEDWIEKDLLNVEKDSIDQIVLRDYSINERTGQVVERDVVKLDKKDGTWKTDRMPSRKEVDSTKIGDLLTTIDELSIVGVRAKPQGLSSSLKRTEGGVSITQADLLSLQSKGYYFTRDGSLLSNEGEMEVRTTGGITYTLRFGEILYGTGEAISAGSDTSDDSQSGPGENRYLFVTSSFDDSSLPEPRKPGNTAFETKPEEEWTDEDKRNKELRDKHAEWERSDEQNRELSETLNARFADWYYVISSDSFDKTRIKRSDILTDKAS